MIHILLAISAAVLFLVCSSLTILPQLPWLSEFLTATLTITLLCGMSVYFAPKTSKSHPERKSGFALLPLLPLFVALTFGLSLLVQWIGRFWDITLPTYQGKLPFLLFAHALIPALTEEFCFRFTIPKLLAPLGEKAVLWGSAVLFALAHGSPLMMVYALVAGLFLGLLRADTQSPLMGMAFHFTNNAFCLILMQYPNFSPLWGFSGVSVLAALFLWRMAKTNPQAIMRWLSPLFSTESDS